MYKRHFFFQAKICILERSADRGLGDVYTGGVQGVKGKLDRGCQHKGKGEIEQQGGDRAGRHVLGHMELSLFFFFFID